MSTRLFWLSFVDNDLPTDQQFLGACVIEVTDAEATGMKPFLLPQSQKGAEWIIAATRKAHLLKCNPGGEIAFHEMPGDHPFATIYPRGVLMDRATIESLEPKATGD